MENSKKILVIDDEAHIRRVLEVKLRNRGYQVVIAKNGEEGLHMIESQHPDVVITDIMMPHLDGKALCEKVNHVKEKQPFLTIVITARISSEDRVWTKRLEDTVFMEKPFSPSRIVEVVEEYLGGQG